MLIKQTHISITLPNLLKEHVSLTHSLTEIKNNETPTSGIKHWGFGGYASILPRIKFGVTGQESSPQSPTISYRRPLANMLPDLYQLENDDLLENSYFMDMLNLDIALKQENRSPYELSSEEYALIEQLAENSLGNAGIKAQSLLEYFYNIPDCNCVNTSVDENKSSSTSFSDNDYANAMGLKVSAEPNPATNWVAFNYELPIDCNEAIIIITNTDGKQIDKLILSDQIHQKVWNTSHLKPGTYIYELMSKELKYTGKIVIVK